MTTAGPPFAAVVFDLDGTLVDSRLDLAAAIGTVRRELGLPALPVAEVVSRVGRGARLLVRECLPPEVEGEGFERAFQRFLDTYLEHCLDATRPYAGVEELLAGLAGAGVPLAVLTNKPERHTGVVLAGLGLAGHFAAVLGGDSLPVKKPDPETLRVTCRRLGVEVGSTLLVGDSAVDAETAAAAGAAAALCGWGFAAAGELDAWPAVCRPRSPRELAAWLLSPPS